MTTIDDRRYRSRSGRSRYRPDADGEESDVDVDEDEEEEEEGEDSINTTTTVERDGHYLNRADGADRRGGGRYEVRHRREMWERGTFNP